MNAILGLLRFLPAALNIGLEIKSVIEQVTGKAVPTNGIEVFAANVMKTLPALIAAGIDVTDAVTRTNDLVRKMIAEKRGPSDEEWADQARRIADLEASLDQAARP